MSANQPACSHTWNRVGTRGVPEKPEIRAIQALGGRHPLSAPALRQVFPVPNAVQLKVAVECLELVDVGDGLKGLVTEGPLDLEPEGLALPVMVKEFVDKELFVLITILLTCSTLSCWGSWESVESCDIAKELGRTNDVVESGGLAPRLASLYTCLTRPLTLLMDS